MLGEKNEFVFRLQSAFNLSIIRMDFIIERWATDLDVEASLYNRKNPEEIKKLQNELRQTDANIQQYQYLKGRGINRGWKKEWPERMRRTKLGHRNQGQERFRRQLQG